MSTRQARKRTSQACLPCGKRKTKCNGSVPTCWQCETTGRECVYGFSKRNKRQARELIVSEPVAQRALDPRSRAHPSTDLEDDSAPFSTPESHENIFNPVKSTGDVDVDPDTSRRLFQAYFSYIHPVWPIIYKPMYDCNDYAELPNHLPKSVVYAIYSIASCIKLDPVGAPNIEVPHHSVFFEAALSVIQNTTGAQTTSRHTFSNSLRLLQPSLDNCQALTLLSLQQHGCAEYSTAFMLLSLASGMAIELGLHRIDSMVIQDHISTQKRSRVLWNLYVLEKIIACELSRPWGLRQEEINMPFPSVNESDEYQLLQFGLPGTPMIKAHTISGFHTTIRLNKIMERVGYEIYVLPKREAIWKDPASGEESRLCIWQDLKDYYASLTRPIGQTARDLRSKEPMPPYLLINVLWALTVIIILHRPFWPHWHPPGSIPKSRPPGSDPLDVSLSTAQEICQIVEIQAPNIERFPCNLIFPILTAATTFSHARQANRGPDDERIIKEGLEVCLHWLSILGKTWKHATESTKKLNIGTIESSTASRRPMTASQAVFGQSISNPTGLERSSMRSDEPSSSRYERTFLDMLGDAEDEFCATNPEFRDFLDQLSRTDLAYN